MNEQDNRPYAATANVLGVIDRIRSRNLPDYLDNEFLRVAQVPEAVDGRVFQALRFLDLIDTDNRPSERLRHLSGVPEAEFRNLLSQAVRDAYAEDFARVDPERDTQDVIVDAFRRYQPRSQTSRMVMLYLGLCRAAGIPVLEAPRERKMQAAPRRHGKSTRTRDGRQGSAARGASRDQEVEAPTRGQGLFSITEEDIAGLPEDEFQVIWDALGKVARARARRSVEMKQQGQTALNSVDEATFEDNEEAPEPRLSDGTSGASEGDVQ